MPEEDFLRDLAEVLLKYPEQLDAFTVEQPGPVDASADAFPIEAIEVTLMEAKRCKRWGRIPGTNRLICLEWEDI